MKALCPNWSQLGLETNSRAPYFSLKRIPSTQVIKHFIEQDYDLA